MVHSLCAYLGYLGGYETIADTMTNPAYRKAAFALMMQERPTLSMPEGADLNAYATLLISVSATRLSSPVTSAIDGAEVTAASAGAGRLHLQTAVAGVALGVAGWMRYTQGVDEQGNAIDVVNPMMAEFQKINALYQVQTA
ncbi:hypothetical protein ACNKHM_08450 [Shigella sonnei]